MKNIEQSKINKIFLIVIIALIAFIGYSKVTEQKRVEYYICYQRIRDDSSRTPDEIKEVCEFIVYE